MNANPMPLTRPYRPHDWNKPTLFSKGRDGNRQLDLRLIATCSYCKATLRAEINVGGPLGNEITLVSRRTPLNCPEGDRGPTNGVQEEPTAEPVGGR